MIKIDELPSQIIELANNNGIKIADYIIAVNTDINSCGEFMSSWIVLTEDILYHFSEDFAYKEEYKFKGYIQEAFFESLVSIGLFTIKTKDGYIEVCKFSNTLVPKFSSFVNVTNKLINDEEIDESSLEENTQHKCSKCGKYLPNKSMRTCPKCIDRKAVISRLFSYGKQFSGKIVLISIFLLLTTLLGMVGPYLSGEIFFGKVLKESNSEFLGMDIYGKVLIVIGIMVVFRLMTMLVSMLYGSFIAKVAGEMVYNIKTDVFESMQRLSMNFFSNKMTGNLMTRINSDTNEILFFFIDGIPYVISSILNILAMGSFMMAFNPWLGLLCVIPPPFVYFFFRKFMPRFRKLHNNVFRRRSRMNSRMNDSLTGMRVVKAFGRETNEVENFAKDSTNYANSAIKVDKVAATVFPLIGQSRFIVTVLVYVVGGMFILNGNLDFGTLVTYLGYMYTMFSPMSGVANIVTWASYALNAANRVFEVIDAIPDIKNCENPVNIQEIKGNVVLKNVSFSYEINKPVLKNISVDVKAGEMIGLVGHSGAGKSTITNVITRLYDVTEGEIFIDGVPIKDINIDNLKSQIGMVLQDTYLFIGTIAENIAYAKPEASREDIIRAAKAAFAHDFIVKLPDGYDTMVGVGGTDLSGGEKQRLSIARAILHNPRILILDEATSALDTETEQQIQIAMEKLVYGRYNICNST